MTGLKRTVTVESDAPVKRHKSVFKKTSVSNINKKVKALVKKTLQQAAEKKKFIYYAANQGIPSGGAGVYPFTASVTPSPAQGPDDGERIGNKIRIVDGWLRGFVNLRPYDVITNAGLPPLWVRILVVSYKKEHGSSIGQTNLLTDFSK